MLLIVLAAFWIAITTNTPNLFAVVHIHGTARFGELSPFLQKHFNGDACKGCPYQDYSDEQKLNHKGSNNVPVITTQK